MQLSRSQLLAGHAEPRALTPQDVRTARAAHPRALVVLDDDPTGTQSVADLPVLTDWQVDSLAWALQQQRPAVYVMTNSRSLDPAEAEQRNREVARAAFAASRQTGVEIDFVSRSDSTLRGHFPLEPATLADEILRETGEHIDGVVIIPAFGDAGRITVDGVHYAGSPDDGYTPVGETEFARDATFGYRSSRMAEWVEEKTAGATRADHVVQIGLDKLRTDQPAVVDKLLGTQDAQPVVCDIVEESDLLALALAVTEAEARGHRFLFRVGPPFPRALIGQDVHLPLSPTDLSQIHPDDVAAGGLVVVGSHVSLTTRQLDCLRERRHPLELEIDVPTVLQGARREAHLTELVATAVEAMQQATVVIRTSRNLVTGQDAASSLAVARAVSDAVVEVVQRIVATRRPRFVIAKGGITSSDVASRGLGIKRAFVRGPMLPGIVSLWEPMDGPAQGVPYIVFAGNVGSQESLADVVDKFEGEQQ